MNSRLSGLVARWLAHPTGIMQAVSTTFAWATIPWLLGWSETSAIFWYLAFCTFISYATQFTIGYQNEQADRKLNEALGTLLQLARNDEADGDALIAQAEAIGTALETVQMALEQLQLHITAGRPDA